MTEKAKQGDPIDERTRRAVQQQKANYDLMDAARDYAVATEAAKADRASQTMAGETTRRLRRAARAYAEAFPPEADD